jgi:GAF domain-containing protein
MKRRSKVGGQHPKLPDGAVIFQLEDGVYRFAAGYSLLPEFLEIEQRALISPGPGTLIGRAAMTREVARIHDALSDPLYEKKEDAKVEGNRSMIGVPLLRGGEPVFVIGMGRRRLDPFGGREIELAKSFASQAVIAIENARLLNELRQRTTDLTDALKQQRATSDLLQVISGFPGNLEPVFQAMLENTVAICGASFGNMFLCEDDAFRTVAMYNAPEAYAKARTSGAFIPPSNSLLGRLAATKEVAHVADLKAEQRYIDRAPHTVEAVELAGIRTAVAVPMLKESHLVGAIVIFRQEVRPFEEKQIELVKNFASQVVIAIENARLLNELRQRTTDLTEALEQQTASAEVLQAISSSAGDLEPVFATMLRKAVSICDAKFGTLYFREGDKLRLIATHGVPPAFAEAQGKAPFRPVSDGMLDAVMRTGRTVHLTDLAHARSYIERDPRTVEAVEIGGIRSVVGVPLIKDDELIGLIGIYRQEVRPFAAKQIEVLTNFAAQAVIAIENARLLNELRQSLEQQTATAQVLQVISRSTGDLHNVFSTIL